MSIIYYCILTYYIDDLQYRTYMAAAPILGYLHIFIFILFTNSTVIQPETDVNYRDDIAFVESGRRFII
jgi:hypothetical protein